MGKTLLFGGITAVCLFCSVSVVFAADGYGANVTGGASQLLRIFRAGGKLAQRRLVPMFHC